MKELCVVRFKLPSDQFIWKRGEPILFQPHRAGTSNFLREPSGEVTIDLTTGFVSPAHINNRIEIDGRPTVLVRGSCRANHNRILQLPGRSLQYSSGRYLDRHNEPLSFLGPPPAGCRDRRGNSRFDFDHAPLGRSSQLNRARVRSCAGPVKRAALKSFAHHAQY